MSVDLPGNAHILPGLEIFLKLKGLPLPEYPEDSYKIGNMGYLLAPIYSGQHPRIDNTLEWKGDIVFGVQPSDISQGQWLIADSYLMQGIGTTSISQSILFDLRSGILDYMAQFMPGDTREQKRLYFIQFCEEQFRISILGTSQLQGSTSAVMPKYLYLKP